MLAIDTNLIVRYLTGDHPGQAARARALVDGYDVFVPTSVLLETEWVLRSVYGFASEQIARALTDFAGLPRVSVQNAGQTATALEWAARGLDFADASHLAASQDCEAFVSFDRDFAKRANAIANVHVRAPA